MVFPHFGRSQLFRNKSLGFGIVALFIGLAISAVDTIWSVYLDSFFHSLSLVGLISGLLSLIAVISYFFSSPIIERYPEARLWFVGTAATILAFLLFSIVKTPAVFLLVAVLFVIMTVVRMEAFGIILRDANKRCEMGKAEGTVYSLMNIGWLLGPLIGGYVWVRLGFGSVFLCAAIFVLLGMVIFLMMRVLKTDHRTRDDGTVLGSVRNLGSFFSRPGFLKVYILSGGISLYWGVLFTFLPLYIVRSGLGPFWVGLFLFGVSVPLALLEYRIGKIADIRGYRPFFIIGYTVLAVAGLLSFFFLLFSNIYGVMIVFIIASVGAACLEGTREAYFFTLTCRSDEERYYGPYLTHNDVFGTIGKLVAAGILLLLAPAYLFLLLALEMAFFLYVASTVREAKRQSAVSATPTAQ